MPKPIILFTFCWHFFVVGYVPIEYCIRSIKKLRVLRGSKIPGYSYILIGILRCSQTHAEARFLISTPWIRSWAYLFFLKDSGPLNITLGGILNDVNIHCILIYCSSNSRTAKFHHRETKPVSKFPRGIIVRIDRR